MSGSKSDTLVKTVLAHNCKYDSLSSVYKIELVAGVILLVFGLRKTQIRFEEAAIPGVEIFIIYP